MYPKNNLNPVALKFWERFVLPNHSQKIVSKHVTGNHGYSIYTNLKFAFEAAKNIRFSHSNLFWGGFARPNFTFFSITPARKSLVRKTGGSGVLPQKTFIFFMLN